MIIAIASDHAGYKLKTQLVEMLSKEYKIIDFGTFSDESCDYPYYAKKVALSVQNGEADRGILLCSTGEGMCIVANKFKGIKQGYVSVMRQQNLSQNIILQI
jgi:ribose 5-phosphate isomerase B